MKFLQRQGNIAPGEMARTFNCGVGMVLAVRRGLVKPVTDELTERGERVYRIGEVKKGKRGCTVRGKKGVWGADKAWKARHDA